MKAIDQSTVMRVPSLHNRMIIKGEKPSDIEAIAEVTKVAFEDHSFSQQTEHFIIRDLRAAGALTISLVAEVDGRVVGHIAFSPVTISDGTTNWYALGPVSVLPDYQGCRIGTALVSKYPPAKPVALDREPLKAVCQKDLLTTIRWSPIPTTQFNKFYLDVCQAGLVRCM